MIFPWWLLAVLSGVGLAIRNASFKVASVKMDAAMAALILSLSMALVAIGYYLFQRLSNNEPLLSPVEPGALWLAILSGAGVAFANILLAMAYLNGGNASLVAILQNSFAITLTIIIGLLILNEMIKPIQILGIAFALTGTLLIIRG